jgi:hypothetical protein
MERVEAAKKAEGRKVKAASSSTLGYWHKRCPQCQAQLHVRKMTCACGHQFGKKMQHRALAIAPIVKD